MQQFFSQWWQKPHVVTMGIVVVALVLRLPQLNGSFWLDEAAQALESSRPFQQQLQIKDDFQPPLLHLVTHFAVSANHSEAWLRWWGALLPALLTIGLVPSLAEALFQPSAPKKSPQKNLPELVPLLVGWGAALWLATNSFYIFFSQELRPYSWSVWWAVLSWFLLLKKSPRPWFVVCSIAGLYTSYLYPFVLIGQFVYLFLWERQKWLSHLSTGVSIILGFLPWLPSFLGQLHAGQQLRLDLPGWETVVSFSQLKVLPLVLGKWLFGVRNLELSWPWITSLAIVIMLIGEILCVVWQKSRRQPILAQQLSRFTAIMISWGVLPLTLAWIISLWVPVIQPKRILWLWPLGALLVAWIVVAGWKSADRKLKIASGALAVLLLGFNLIGLIDYYTSPLLQRENWRSLQTQISHDYSPNSTILVFAFPAPFASWQWYDQSRFPTINTGYLVDKSPEFTHTTLNRITDFRFVLVFDYLRTLTDPQDLILHSLESAGYKGVGVIDYPNIGFVRIYARPDSLLGADDQVHWVSLSVTSQGKQP